MSIASANQGFAMLIVFGLCFGALGDILLNLRFVFPANGQKIFLMGVVAFLTGHILYLRAIVLMTTVAIGNVFAAPGPAA